MAYRLFGAPPLSEAVLPYCQSGPKGIQLNFEFKIFISEKVLENVVCETVAILSRLQCVNIGKINHENINIQLQFYQVSRHLLCLMMNWHSDNGLAPNRRGVITQPMLTRSSADLSQCTMVWKFYDLTI